MIERIFDTDNGFWQTVGRVGDLILLTLLTFVCCIPVITAGASLCAMHYVCFKMMENDNSSTIKYFFHSFRQNLAQGAVMTLIMGAVGFLLWYDGWFLRQISGTPLGSGILFFAGWALYIYLLFVYVVLFLYLFPLQARFYNPLAVTFKNAVIAGFKNLPKTVMMLIGDGCVFLIIVLCFVYFPQIAFLPPLIALPLCAWYNAWVLRGLLGLVPGKLDLPVPDGGDVKEPKTREQREDEK